MERAGAVHRMAGKAGIVGTVSMLNLSTPQFCASVGVGVQEFEAYTADLQKGEQLRAAHQ
jgi:hypothetical protein